LMLSTCNRVEVLAAGPCASDATGAIKEFLAREKSLKLKDFEDSLYVCESDEACRHLFRVTSSLDSMIVGEPQILGQVKESYRQATLAKTTGVILNKLMHRGFSVAKRIRKETGIGDHAVSVSYAAVELAKKIFDDLLGRKVLLVGAGEMAELAVEHLINHRAKDIFVANRTFERAVALARRFSGTPVQFSEIGRVLTTVDIVISSTGSPDIVINKEMAKAAMKARKNRPLFFIDIAVPRDVDPQINQGGRLAANDYLVVAGILQLRRPETAHHRVRHQPRLGRIGGDDGAIGAGSRSPTEKAGTEDQEIVFRKSFGVGRNPVPQYLGVGAEPPEMKLGQRGVGFRPVNASSGEINF